MGKPLKHQRRLGLFLHTCEVIKYKMEVISKQKIHSDVVFKHGCRPELESLSVKRKCLKIGGYHGNVKLQVCQTTLKIAFGNGSSFSKGGPRAHQLTGSLIDSE